MKLHPVHDRIVVKRIKPDEVTGGGILLPDSEKPSQGEVIAVGPGTRDKCDGWQPLVIKVGDRVLLNRHHAVMVDGEELLVMREEDVLAVVTDE